jgi:ribosomal protein S18 acetylase RimI-like enzyme
MIIRPISSHEVEKFAQFAGRNTHAESVLDYIRTMFERGAMRPEWCYVAEENGVFIGSVGYWTFRSNDAPTDFVLLELPWERPDYLSIGKALFAQSLPSFAVEKLLHVVDQPPSAPQWQYFSEQHHAFLESMGCIIERKTRRFAWNAANPTPVVPARLNFRSLPEVGENAFIEAIERVSANTFDQRIEADRKRLGTKGEAIETFRDLQDMEYSPDWWQLAYNANGALVGLSMPSRNPSAGTIGYIGVVPEMRGCGYINDLLAQATWVLLSAGHSLIRADTDVANFPMANAFLRAGYEEFATRTEYMLTL